MEIKSKFSFTCDQSRQNNDHMVLRLAISSLCLCLNLPQFTWLPPHIPSMLAVRLGGDTGAVSYQQSHCAATGHSDSHIGGAYRASARRVWGVTLVGMGAHVTLELRGCLTLHPAQLAEQDPAGPCPTETPSYPTALLPLLAMVLLSVHTQVGEGGEAWKTPTYVISIDKLLEVKKYWNDKTNLFVFSEDTWIIDQKKTKTELHLFWYLDLDTLTAYFL